MVIDPNGPLCICGARGCLEALAAGPAIARMGEEAARSKRDTLLRDYHPMSAEAVYQAAKEGDAAAQAIIEQVSAYLALAIQQIIVAYDVECIVLGGGVSHDGQAFLEPVVRQLNRLRESSALTNEMIQTDKIRLLRRTTTRAPGVRLSWRAAGCNTASKRRTDEERR